MLLCTHPNAPTQPRGWRGNGGVGREGEVRRCTGESEGEGWSIMLRVSFYVGSLEVGSRDGGFEAHILDVSQAREVQDLCFGVLQHDDVDSTPRLNPQQAPRLISMITASSELSLPVVPQIRNISPLCPPTQDTRKGNIRATPRLRGGR